MSVELKFNKHNQKHNIHWTAKTSIIIPFSGETNRIATIKIITSNVTPASNFQMGGEWFQVCISFFCQK